jgi:carboxymethylenebutenolidase
MDEATRRSVIDLYDRYTHGGMKRRAFISEMIKLAGSVAAADLLIGGIAAAPVGAAQVRPDDSRLVTRSLVLGGTDGVPRYKAYSAHLRQGPRLRPAVLVIHENRGLNGHIEDVARRIALAGYTALAPDLLTPQGGTPADEDAAREKIGKLDLGATVGQVARIAQRLKAGDRHLGANGKVGAVGFCWGGGFVDRLAIAADGRLDAAVSYYGPAPDPAEAAKVRTPLLLHFAGLDTRVNPGGLKWADALKAAHKPVEVFVYPNVNHAFNNDTSKERYDAPAAQLAWKRTLAFLKSHLS